MQYKVTIKRTDTERSFESIVLHICADLGVTVSHLIRDTDSSGEIASEDYASRAPMKWEIERALALLDDFGIVRFDVLTDEPLTGHEKAEVAAMLANALKELEAAAEVKPAAKRRGRPAKADALPQAAHQARHKERLRAAGLTETKVRVRQGQEEVMRAIAAALVGGALTEAQLRQLLEPKPAKPARKPRAKPADADLTAPDPRQVTLYEAIEAAKARRMASKEGGEHA